MTFSWLVLSRLVDEVPLFDPVRVREPIPKRISDKVHVRDKACVVCGSDKSLRVHHVVPNGPATPRNLVLLCRECHEFVHLKLAKKGYKFYRPWRNKK